MKLNFTESALLTLAACGCATPTVRLTDADRSQIHRLSLIAEYSVRNDAVPNFDMSVLRTLIRETDPRPIIRDAILASLRPNDSIKIEHVQEVYPLWFKGGQDEKNESVNFKPIKALLQPLGYDGILMVRATSAFSQAQVDGVAMRLEMSARIFRLSDNKQIYQRFEYQLFGWDYAVILPKNNISRFQVSNILPKETWMNSLDTFTRKHWTNWIVKDVMSR